MDFENTLNNHEFQLPENWNYYMCQIDEMPASYFVNLALAEIAPISQRLQLIWLEIKMNQPREDGLSSSEEFDHLMVFEDEIIPSLTDGSQSIYVGRLTHNKVREFYFYCKDATVLEHKIQLIMQKFSQYSYQTGHRDEPRGALQPAMHILAEIGMIEHALQRVGVEHLQQQRAHPAGHHADDIGVHLPDRRIAFKQRVVRRGCGSLSLARIVKHPAHLGNQFEAQRFDGIWHCGDIGAQRA